MYTIVVLFLALNTAISSLVEMEGAKMIRESDIRQYSSNPSATIQEKANEKVVADLEEYIRKYADYISRKLNVQVEWSKINMPEFEVSVRNIEYGSVVRELSRPGSTYVQWFHNGLTTQPIKGHMEKTVERTNSFTWNVTHSFKVGVDLKIQAGIPIIFSSEIHLYAEYSLESTTSTSTSLKETFSISHEIIADPQKSVKAVWVINEKVMDVEWIADVDFGGWFHIKFVEPYKGAHLWGFPMSSLLEIDSTTFKRGPLELVYTTRGIFHGIRGTESIITAYEYPFRGRRFQTDLSPPLNITILEKIVFP